MIFVWNFDLTNVVLSSVIHAALTSSSSGLNAPTIPVRHGYSKHKSLLTRTVTPVSRGTVPPEHRS